MHLHSGNRITLVVQTLIVLCLTGVGIGQDTTFFTGNSQILKAFRDEMKTLEAAAHRVNALFMNHASPNQEAPLERYENPVGGQSGDSKSEPTNKELEVTVLANPEILKNNQNQEQKPVKESATSAPEDKQKQKQSGLESSYGPFGSFFNNYFYRQEPWWKGQHVCVDRTEKIIQNGNNKDSVQPEPSFVVMGRGTFERCKQTSGKYVCTTVTNSPQESKTVTVTYQCCEGYRKQGRSCIEGEDSLEKVKAIEDDNSRGRNGLSSGSISDSSSISSSISNSNEADDKINVGNNYEKTVMRSPYVPVKIAVIKSKNYPKQEDQRLSQSKQNQAKLHNINDEVSYSSSSNEDVNLKPSEDVLDELGAKEFSSLLRVSGLEGSIASHNHTIFAPIDEVMKEYSDTIQESNQIPKRRRRRIEPHAIDRTEYEGESFEDEAPDSKDIVNAHLIDSLMEVEDFSNELLLSTSGNVSTIRINIYPGRKSAVVTANCARFVSCDNLAVNSRIHTVDRVLNKVNKSVSDILKQPQFLKFRTFLENNGLLSEIESSQSLTVFAPVNEAWNKLEEGLKEMYARGEACIDMVLKHHLLPLTLCLAPTHEGRISTTDIVGELLYLEMDNNGDIIIDNKSRVLYGDLVGTNGVVHALDKVLIPQSAKSVSDLLAFTNHTTWLNLLNKAGVAEELNRASNMTLFVPSEQVLTDPETKTQLQNMDNESLRKTILYHAANIRSSTCDFKDSLELESRLEGRKLKVHMIHSFPLFAGLDARTLVQCAPIIYADGKACHTVAHEIDRLLIPPKGTILQEIASNSKLSRFRRIIEGTKIESELEHQNGEVTLLAPSNEAFNKLDDQKLTKLLTDKNYADQVIRRHILPEPVCCSSVSSVPWPFTNTVTTLQGRKIEVNRNINNVLFGPSTAEQCDIMANDGIVHIINNVLLPHTLRTKMGSVGFGTPTKQIFLYGI